MKWYDVLKATGPLGWLGWLFHGVDKNRNLVGSISNGVTSVWNKFTGAGLTGSEREANAFSSEEAQKQRDWEEEMRNTSFQAQVRDMQAAGINPAVMYGGTSASGASVPSSSAPSSVSPSSGDFTGLIGRIMDMALLGAQKENIEADTQQKLAGAERDKAETERTNMLTPVEIDNIMSQIDLRDSDMTYREAQTSVEYANLALLEADLQTREQFNQINLRLAEANAAESEAKREEILQQTENLKRDFAISFAQEAVVKAQEGLLSQQTKNALVEHGILEWNKKTSEYDAALTEYNYDHADGNRVWNRIATGASVLRDTGIAAGAFIGGAAKGVTKGVTETITNTSQKVFNSKGKLIKTVVTNQNRNK